MKPGIIFLFFTKNNKKSLFSPLPNLFSGAKRPYFCVHLKLMISQRYGLGIFINRWRTVNNSVLVNHRNLEVHFVSQRIIGILLITFLNCFVGSNDSRLAAYDHLLCLEDRKKLLTHAYRGRMICCVFPVTNADVERSFSKMGWLIGALKSRLGHTIW